MIPTATSTHNMACSLFTKDRINVREFRLSYWMLLQQCDEIIIYLPIFSTLSARIFLDSSSLTSMGDSRRYRAVIYSFCNLQYKLMNNDGYTEGISVRTTKQYVQQ